MKKTFKKIIGMTLAIVIVFTATTTNASAKTVNISGYKHYKSYKCTTYMKGTVTSGFNSVKFSGQSGGKYKGKKTPDSITHSDIIKSTGIGSINVSYNGSAGSGTASISGNTLTENYTVKNKKSITIYPTYKGASSLVTFWVTFSTSTKYKFGSTYVVVASGDAS